MIQKLPCPISQIIKFACFMGLRPSEVIESVRLINDKDAFQNTIVQNYRLWNILGFLTSF